MTSTRVLVSASVDDLVTVSSRVSTARVTCRRIGGLKRKVADFDQCLRGNSRVTWLVHMDRRHACLPPVIILGKKRNMNCTGTGETRNPMLSSLDISALPLEWIEESMGRSGAPYRLTRCTTMHSNSVRCQSLGVGNCHIIFVYMKSHKILAYYFRIWIVTPFLHIIFVYE